MERTTPVAGVVAGAGAVVAGGVAAAGAVAWAASGAAQPPRIVPTKRTALPRLPSFNVEITRSRPLCKIRSRYARRRWISRPALSDLANQAPKPVPQPERSQIVKGREEKQGKEQRKSAPESPILAFRADGAPPNRLDRIE